ncbi:MAG: NAD(P)/FAD-dependent oxidoreductase [Acidobacteria bacterium]|nr:NAD(P)/FAD-dependent oxidoreductase [Acidobacteriota bacterium]
MTDGPHVPHIVIVGGGFAGLDASRALAREPVRVTLVDRHNHHVFQPLLYQVATAGLSPGDIASPIRWILRRQANLRVLLATVERVDPAAKCLHLDGGQTLAYDALILATGVTHSYFGHDDWQPRAPGLKTLDDALEIRKRVLLAFEKAERETDPARQRRLLTFVIVGGGPTGVELAGALAEIARQALRSEFDNVDPASARILLLEAGPSILTTFPDSLRASARRSLTRLGVQVREGTAVTSIDEGGVMLGGERIEADTVLWAAGVQASSLGRCFGTELDRAGRVVVEPDLSVPGFPDVFIAGDLASFTHQTGRPLPGVAQAAKQLGRHAARNAVRRLSGEPTRPFRYLDPGNLATIGRNAAIADFGFLRLSGYLGWLFWVFLHIFFLIGFRNRASVMLQWAISYVTYQRSVRLITHDD